MNDPNIDGYETYCIGKIDAYCKELEAKLQVAVELMDKIRRLEITEFENPLYYQTAIRNLIATHKIKAK